VPSAERHGARGRVLADLAIGRMRTRGKLAELSQAVTGRFTDHHAVLGRLRLDRIALFGTAVAGLGAKIAVRVSPYQRELDLLRLVPGSVTRWAVRGWPRSARPRMSTSQP
jgi:transposase